MRVRILSGLVALGLSACATTGTVSDAKVSYSETARLNFEAGEKALLAGKNEEAIALFEYVRNKYPYSKYAADSDLRIADTYFSLESWVEAADAYDFFVRFHPVHEKIAYAVFRKAKSNFNAMPSDFFLFPKAYTKDQTATKDSLESIEKFLTQFPTDPNVKEAQEMRIKLREQLALQGLYIAQFYAARKKWKGAANRFDDIAKTYPDTSTARQALFATAEIKRDYLGKKDEANEALSRLVKDYPGSVEATKAEAALKVAQ